MGGSFIAAYEIINNIAIYTAPGVDSAYTVFEVAIIGTGGLNVLGAACTTGHTAADHLLVTTYYWSQAIIVALAVSTQLLPQCMQHIKSTLLSVLLNSAIIGTITTTTTATASTGEAAIRSRYEGFTTDATRPLQIWGLDFNPTDGTFTKRECDA
eukprot:20125-Heterococcus_DN1.PRE.1